LEKPVDFGPEGSSLWDEIAGDADLVLRPDEFRLLELACRQLDMIASLRAAFNAKPEYIVKGSTGQPVVNPLVAEIRTASSAFASLMRQLGVPDSDERAEQRSAEMSKRMSELGRISWMKRSGRVA